MRRYARVGLALLFLLLPSIRGDCVQESSTYSPDLGRLSSEAQQAQRQGDYRRAAAIYTEILAHQPHLPEVRSNLGLMHHFLGEYKEAVSTFQLALADNPRLYTANLFLGLDLLNLHDPQKALPFLEKACRLNKQDAQAQLGLAAAYKELRKADKARNAYEAATQIDPRNPDAWFGLGSLYLDLQESAVDQLADLGKNSSYARALVAHALMEQGLPDAALDIYLELLKSRPEVPCLQADMGFAYMQTGHPQSAEAAFNAEVKEHPGCLLARLGLARIALERGKASEAFENLFGIWTADQDFLRWNLAGFWKGLDPETVSLLTKISESASGSERELEFGRFLRSVIQAWQEGSSDPSTSSSLPSLSVPGRHERVTHAQFESGPAPVTLLSEGHYTGCKHNLQVKIAPLDPADLKMLCQCAYYAGDYRSSFLAGAQLARHPPETLPGLYWEAKSAEKLGISALKQVGVLAPDSPRLHFLMGELYRQKWQEERAVAEYRRVLELQPNDLVARIGLADAYNRATRYGEALPELQTVLALDTMQPEANYLMGSILVNQHLFTKALPYLETALKGGTSKAPLIHALISRVHAAQGETTEAISELRQALRADRDGSLHYQLFLLYRKLGDQAAAATALEQSKALSLNGTKHRPHDDISETSLSGSPSIPQTGADYETTEKRVH